MKRAFIIFLLFFLFSSGCTTRVPDYASHPYAGTQAGTMSWDVNGAIVRPSPVWTYNGKDVFSEWYYRAGNLNVSGDVVYISGDRLTALDLKTGHELWETQLKNSLPNENAVTCILFPTIYKDKIVAVGARLVVEKGSDYYSERRNVLVFDRVTGKLLWKSVDIGSKLEYFNQGYPVILNNRIYLPALNGEYRAAQPGYQSMASKKEERGIWVWDLNTGKLLDKIFFSFPEGELCLSITNVISDGENLYVMAGVTPSVDKTNRTLDPQYLIAFNPRDGKVLWQIQLTDNMAGTTGFNSSGMNSKVIVVSRSVAPTATHGPDSWIRAYDKKTGKILWRKPIKVWVSAVDISLTEDGLFAQVTDNSLSCFDPMTGKEIWTYKCNYRPPSAGFFTVGPVFCPFLTRNVLYLTSIDMIIALDPDTGKELWSIVPPFPKIIDEEENSNGSWRFIPVDSGFVTLYADFSMSGDAMLSPPFVQLWSATNNKK